MDTLKTQRRWFTRFFLILGIAAFFYHRSDFHETSALVFIGPAIYLAHFTQSFLQSYVEIQHFGPPEFLFLLPATLLYYGLVGFLTKQVLNERGWIKRLTLFSLTLFLVFIHFFTWHRLTGYFAAPPA